MGDSGWGLGAIVCCDCSHSLDTRISKLVFGCLEKGRPFITGADLRIFVDFFERVLGSITALRSRIQCSTYHMYASAWAETAGLVLEPNPSLKSGITIGKGFWAKTRAQNRRF